MKKNIFEKGFTLIELLVVIAVIALLASVVVSSLSGARSKASDKAVMSDLNNIRIQANLYYVNNSNSYAPTVTNSCASGMYNTDATILNAITHASTNSTAVTCNTLSSTVFAVASKLKGSGYYYCVDSTNSGKTNTTATNIYGSGATFALDSVTGLCN
ncbi:MAG: type II secretion system protein [Patescibacteria group bacterium]